MLYEPYTCIDHKQEIAPFYDVDGYSRCHSSMLCFGCFFLFSLAAVFLADKRAKSGVTNTTTKDLTATFDCCSGAVCIEIAGSSVRPFPTLFHILKATSLRWYLSLAQNRRRRRFSIKFLWSDYIKPGRSWISTFHPGTFNFRPLWALLNGDIDWSQKPLDFQTSRFGHFQELTRAPDRDIIHLRLHAVPWTPFTAGMR